MRITNDGVYALNYTSAYTIKDASRVVLASGRLGTATATIGYLDDQGDFVAFQDRSFLLDKRMEILHGVGVTPYLSVKRTTPSTDIRIWVSGISTVSSTGSINTGGGIDDKHYLHTQVAPLAIWTINHNLNKKPSVTVTDVQGNEVVAAIKHVDTDNALISFTLPFSGIAQFN